MSIKITPRLNITESYWNKNESVLQASYLLNQPTGYTYLGTEVEITNPMTGESVQTIQGSAVILDAFLQYDGTLKPSVNTVKTLCVPCKPNTQYTVILGKAGAQNNIGESSSIPTIPQDGTASITPSNLSFTDWPHDEAKRYVVMTTGAEACYLFIYFYNSDPAAPLELTWQDALNTIGITEGAAYYSESQATFITSVATKREENDITSTVTLYSNAALPNIFQCRAKTLYTVGTIEAESNWSQAALLTAVTPINLASVTFDDSQLSGAGPLVSSANARNYFSNTFAGEVRWDETDGKDAIISYSYALLNSAGARLYQSPESIKHQGSSNAVFYFNYQPDADDLPTTFRVQYATVDGYYSQTDFPLTLAPLEAPTSAPIITTNIQDSKLTYTIQNIPQGIKASIYRTAYDCPFAFSSARIMLTQEQTTGEAITHIEAQPFLSFGEYSIGILLIDGASSTFYKSTQRLDIEHIYLTDSTATHLFLYNPTIGSLKRNTADIITPTLGGAYPFTFRNGAQKYYSFTFGGLISCADNSQVYQNSDLDWQIQEKVYRDLILDFLYNDKIKLFQSGPEGNMLIKLSAIALTPEAKLGRNIYSFSATATEVDDLSNATEYGILIN